MDRTNPLIRRFGQINDFCGEPGQYGEHYSLSGSGSGRQGAQSGRNVSEII